jgi:hypothetical protein
VAVAGEEEDGGLRRSKRVANKGERKHYQDPGPDDMLG